MLDDHASGNVHCPLVAMEGFVPELNVLIYPATQACLHLGHCTNSSIQLSGFSDIWLEVAASY